MRTLLTVIILFVASTAFASPPVFYSSNNVKFGGKDPKYMSTTELWFYDTNGNVKPGKEEALSKYLLYKQSQSAQKQADQERVNDYFQKQREAKQRQAYAAQQAAYRYHYYGRYGRPREWWDIKIYPEYQMIQYRTRSNLSSLGCDYIGGY